MNFGDYIGIGSIFIAIIALGFSIYSFNKQQDRAEEHAKATVKPLLSIKSQNYLDLKSIRLINYGVGPAIIRHIEFKHPSDGRTTNKIVELFDLNIVWESFVDIPKDRVIPAEGEVVLIKQSLEHLVKQGIDNDDALMILRKWKSQKTGITIHIEYEDLYGNEMKTIDQILN
jgi:hypothetical protein